MSVYDRSERKYSYLKSVTTTAHVGPGTYDLDAPGKSKKDKGSYAPFLSLRERDGLFSDADYLTGAPGPGYYDPGTASASGKGLAFASSKVQRFKAKTSQVPGPGAYNLGLHHKEATSGGPLRTRKCSPTRIQYHRKNTAPSIPIPNQAYGYEEDEGGSLIKQPAPEMDSSMGPAYYNPDNAETGVTRTYKGVKFGNRTGRRMEFKIPDIPGPGAYNPSVNEASMKDAPRQEVYIPRFIEQVVQEEEKKNAPGPGKYKLLREFDKAPKRVNMEGIRIEQPPFGSQEERFQGWKDTAPPVGVYNDPRTALGALRKPAGLKKTPFGQSASRFLDDRDARFLPGPGAYNHKGFAADSLKKSYMESTRRGVFGTTSARIKPIQPRDVFGAPGPADYQLNEAPYKPQSVKKAMSANFASRSHRAVAQKRASSPIQDYVGPGSYDVVHAVYALDKPKRAPPRTKDAQKRLGAFQASGPRLLKAPVSHTPGPGAYDHSDSLNPRGGAVALRTKRFDETVNPNPGPGDYELSPLFLDTVLRGTFNVTLNNPFQARWSKPDAKAEAAS